MINFLHTFEPNPILLSFGFIQIHWYGLILVVAMLSAMFIANRLGTKQGLKKDSIFDLSFYLILGGLAGARIYDIFLELPYYLSHPAQMLKIWEGGLAIHGAIIIGFLILVLFARKNKLNFWQIGMIIAPALALGQAIGRWGNYFNQELFGLPTSLRWGIPININNRPAEFILDKYFQPTFLYESLGCLIIFFFLLVIIKFIEKKIKKNNKLIILPLTFYVISYSILRFFLEFIKIDTTPILGGLRWPQITSLALILIFLILIFYKTCSSKEKNLLK